MEKKNSPFKATKLWNQLISSFIEGMELKRRRYRFKSYENSFSGTDALDWMLKYLQNHPSYGDNITKEQAFMLLQKFMDNKVFESVTGKIDKFQDSNSLYKFNKEKEPDGQSSTKKITIPSQNSITNLLNNVTKDLEKESQDTNALTKQDNQPKTSALFEPCDEENLEVHSGPGFFTRSSSLRLRKPLTSLTTNALNKADHKGESKSTNKHLKPGKPFTALNTNVSNKATMKSLTTNNNKNLKANKKQGLTMPPIKRSLNEQFSMQVTADRKRKSTPHQDPTIISNGAGKNPKFSKKLFKTAINNNSKQPFSKLGINKIESVDNINEKFFTANSAVTPEKMDTSPVSNLYKSQQIMQHFSPSPMRRKLRKSRSSDLMKLYKSRSQYDLAKSHCSGEQGLYKANSSWDLNNLEGSANGRNFMLSKERLTPEQLQDTWKSVVLLSLRKLMRMEHVGEYIDEYQISGQAIMQNMECNEKSVKDSIPEWLFSAMECLMKWPNYDQRGVVGDLPNYIGFHCDVFHAIKEHYHSSSDDPLIPCHLTSLLEECMEYADTDIEITIQVLQHMTLLIDNEQRCHLQALVYFMKKVSDNPFLRISNDLSNKDLMVHSFFRIISRKESHFLINQTEILGIRVVYCLMQFYDEIFTAPKGLRVQVDHKIAVIYGNLHQNAQKRIKIDTGRPSSADAVNKRVIKRPVTYCEQISKQEYQQEAVDFSKQEIKKLLQAIVNDRSLSSKEVTRRLGQALDKIAEKRKSDGRGDKLLYGDFIWNGFVVNDENLNLVNLTECSKSTGDSITKNEYLVNLYQDRRHSLYEGIFSSPTATTDLDWSLLKRSFVYEKAHVLDIQMGSVDQDDIIALTKHVRSFSESLNSLRNTFNDSLTNGIYNEKGCHDLAHNRLSEVLGMLKKILSKYPHLHSQDILDAAKNIIRKIRDHNYSIGEQGPEEYYAAIDQLALSFSSSVSEFVLGDKDSPHSPSAGLEQEDDDHFHHDEEYDPKQYDEDFDKNESEDSLDHNNSYEVLHQNLQRLGSSLDYRSISHDNELTTPSSPTLSPKDLSIQRTDELDKTLRSIEDSVELTLTRTKVWTKYAKDILNYLEKRSHFEADCSKQIAKLAQTTRSNIVEESFLPFQSIFVTALDNDIQFSNNFGKNCENPLKGIIDKLAQRQRDHDAKRSKLKGKWKNELKRVAESRENLRNAKAQYMRKQKELEKFNKLQQEGKDEKGFSIGKKKGQEDFIKSADDSEHYYKQCVNESNRRQQELERMKSESLIELRQLVYQCDMTMKQVTIAYFQMMHQLLNPLPVQYKTLAESCKNYEEGQQFADFVKLQQSTSNQAMCPTYQFEPYRGEGVTNNSLRHQTDGNVLAISSDDFHSNRRMSINSESEKPKQAWAGSLPRNKGSATDDTDSQSSRSLPNSREASPTSARKLTETYSDDESHTRGGQKNQKRSTAAKSHKFKKLRTASKCKECESLVYFNGFECEKCGIICHKKCLEKLAIQCGNKRLPRKMTTFGVDFHQHLEATKRKDIPYIMEKCIDTLDEIGLGAKGLYRVSGVKSKVEKLCQQFETGGHLIDLTSTHQQPQLIASVLKLYLRQLPEPLLTFKLYQPFIDLAKESGPIKLSDLDELDDQHASQYEEVIKKVHDIVKRLPSANFYTAGKLIRHLKRVANHAHENQMSPSNLAIVFGPTLLRPEGDANSLSAVMDMSLQTRAVELLILNDRIFVDETNIIEVTMQEKKFNRPSMRKKRQPVPETVQEVPAEHKRDDSNIASEFSQELLHIKFDSVTNTATVKQTPQLPGQPDNSGDYDNIPGDIETDIAGDLPVIPNVNGNANYNTQTSTSLSDTTDYESAHSRLSSIESLLDDGSVNFNSQSPVELPDASSPVSPTSEEIDDDVWMNQFGKDNKRRSPDSGLEGSPATNVPVTLPLKKKPSSPSSRLETTTYSFSIGSTELTPEDANTDQPGDLNDLSPSDSLDGLEPFVKRDSKERQPVRGKHLKAVNVKATINVSPEQPSPKSSPQVPQKAVVESTRSVDSGINDVNDLHQSGVSVENNRHPSTASAESEKDGSPGLTVNITQAQKLQNITEKSENSGGGADQTTQKSPTKQGPMTLPKPKKTLDKKSWTADLIKSKTQKIPEQPQPGSLNERLLQQGSVKRPSATAEDIPPVSPDTQESSDAVFPPRSASVGHRSSVRDIRNRFQNNLINNSSPGDDLHESTETEKFV